MAGFLNARVSTVAWLDTDASAVYVFDDVGDSTYDLGEPGGTTAVPIKHRGVWKGMVEGDDVWPTFSLSLTVARESWSDGSATRWLDAVGLTGSFAADGTTDISGVTAMGDLRLTFSTTDGTPVVCDLFLRSCRCSISISESMEGTTVSLSGTAYEGFDTLAT